MIYTTGSSGEPLRCLQDLQALGRTSAPLSYGPDPVWSYEIGEKSKVLDERLTLNGDVYYPKWSKVQEPVDRIPGSPVERNRIG
jgi:outer membrane receptor for monomeric catechols